MTLDADLSVVIPLFESAETIERTARSLGLVQDRGRVEVLVVDDGSTDDGPERARRALEPLRFGSFALLQQPNAGSGAARNAALARASGRWLYFLDADDELAVDPLPLLRAASSAATALLAAAIVVRDGRTVLRYRPPAITRANARRVLSAGNPLPVSALLLRRSALERPFDTGLRYLEDWNFWLENPGLFAHPIARRDVVLTRIHAHGGNKSSQYPAIGRCRERIAASRLERNDGVLGAVERNNWRLQREIGRMLQGSRPRWSQALSLPCSPVLLAKFLAHALAGRRVLRHDPYAPDR